MNTLDQIRRALRPGVDLQVENHVYPSLSGRRTVLRSQTTKFLLSFPEGHPRHGEWAGSWLDLPPRSRVTFHDDGSFTFHRDPAWEDAGPFCTIRVLT